MRSSTTSTIRYSVRIRVIDSSLAMQWGAASAASFFVGNRKTWRSMCISIACSDARIPKSSPFPLLALCRIPWRSRMILGLADTHAAAVHRDDLVVEPREAPLMFGDQLRIKGRPPIARHLDLDVAGVGQHRLLAIAVAAVPIAVAGIEKMIPSRRSALARPAPSPIRRADRPCRMPSWHLPRPVADQVSRRGSSVVCVVPCDVSFAIIVMALTRNSRQSHARG